MPSHAIIPLFILAFSFSFSATCSDVVDEVAPAVVGLKIRRSNHQRSFTGSRIQRRQGVTVELDNELTSYTANLSLGTPPQDVIVRVDTGSSDLWLNSPSSRLCSYRLDPCAEAGTYNANDSSTYEFVSSDFAVSYADGSGATGDYVTDHLNIGDISLDNFQFGVGYESGSQDGILGIGYQANEAQVDTNGQRPYANLPQALVESNRIKSNAYSLWLDDRDSASGSILFGGVDTDKYVGSLQTLPVERINGDYIHFVLAVSGMSIQRDGDQGTLNTDLPFATILDSGSTITYLPDQLVRDLYNALDVRYSRRQGALCRCDLANENISVNFTFSSLTINVPIRELVIDPEQSPGQQSNAIDKRQYSNSGGSNSVCLFGISPSSGTVSILGDTFLRSAYVVYDLDNNEISMAQTNFDSTRNNVREIGTGTDAVPDATRVSNVVQASVTNSGGPRIGTPSTTSDNDSESIGSGKSSLLTLPPMLISFLTAVIFWIVNL